jgi:hypothetical protein
MGEAKWRRIVEQAFEAVRKDQAARFNRKDAAAWRLVRLPSMLGPSLEDSRSRCPPRSARRNARLSTKGRSHKSQP